LAAIRRERDDLVPWSKGDVAADSAAETIVPIAWQPAKKQLGHAAVQGMQQRAQQGWHEPCMKIRTGCSSLAKVAMLVTLVAVLCNGPLCLEKIVTTSDQSGITMTACQVNAQIGIAEWLANGPYHEWKLQRYKCVMGKYIPKGEA
jgi:hypothetical protein